MLPGIWLANDSVFCRSLFASKNGGLIEMNEATVISSCNVNVSLNTGGAARSGLRGWDCRPLLQAVKNKKQTNDCVRWWSCRQSDRRQQLNGPWHKPTHFPPPPPLSSLHPSIPPSCLLWPASISLSTAASYHSVWLYLSIHHRHSFSISLWRIWHRSPNTPAQIFHLHLAFLSFPAHIVLLSSLSSLIFLPILLLLLVPSLHRLGQ